jgi:arylsulfatase A-like enzyme
MLMFSNGRHKLQGHALLLLMALFGRAVCMGDELHQDGSPLTLLAHFSFDDGTIVGSTVLDQSGSNHDATLINDFQSVITGAPGAFGRGVRFRYGDNSKGMITLPAGIVPSGTDERTFSMWFRMLSEPGLDPGVRLNKPFGYGTAGSGNAFDCSIRGSYVDILVSGATSRHEGASESYEDDDQWHHLAVVVEPEAADTSGISVYLDGILMRQISEAAPFSTEDTTFQIGTSSAISPAASDFSGYIDDFRIYGTSLKSNEVASLASDTPSPFPGSVCYFDTVPKNRVPAGAPVTLRWKVSGAQTISIEPEVGDVTLLTTNGVGTSVVAPLTTTTYTLTVDDGLGTPITASQTIHIGESPYPNIILFLVDDMGWADWEHNRDDASHGDYATATIETGSRFYETPAINKLAQEGMWFRNGYAASPVCSPSRASIMTGQSPGRSHISNWISGEGDHDRLLYEAEWTKNIPLTLRTNSLAAVLRRNGYRTIHVGKWHLGQPANLAANPVNCGFDINIGGNHSGTPPHYFAGASGNFALPYLGAGVAEENDYLPDVLINKALETVEAAATNGDAFFLNMCHYLVHEPIAAPSNTIAKYIAKLGSSPDPLLAFGEQTNVAYAAMVEHLDNSLSNLLAKLDSLNIATNTLIVFYSDNGGWNPTGVPMNDESGSFGSGRPTVNLPLRGGKGENYEGGIRGPVLFRWPGRIAPATISDEPVISYDLYPTLLQIAGANVPESYAVDGQDLSPLLGLSPGMFSRKNPLIFHYPHYSPQGNVPSSAIRKGDYKLIYNYEQAAWQLYNLVDDIGESNDLSATTSDRTAILSYDLSAALESMSVHYPRSKTTLGELPPDPLVDPANHSDADDIDDYSELVAGTDIENSDDFPWAAISLASSSVPISLSGKQGRFYTLMCSEDLDGSSWTPVDTAGPLDNDEQVVLTDPAFDPAMHDRQYWAVEITFP